MTPTSLAPALTYLVSVLTNSFLLDSSFPLMSPSYSNLTCQEVIFSPTSSPSQFASFCQLIPIPKLLPSGFSPTTLSDLMCSGTKLWWFPIYTVSWVYPFFHFKCLLHMCACSVMSSSLQLPWTVSCQAPLSIGSSSKNTGVGCHLLLQGVFLTQGSNPHLLCLWQWQMDSLPLSHLGNLLLIELNTHTDTQFIISQFPCVSLKSRHGTPGSSAQGLSGLKRCQPGLWFSSQVLLIQSVEA